MKAIISKAGYGFNTFAANRIGEIQPKTDPQERFWMVGVLNIADWVTIEKSPGKLGPCVRILVCRNLLDHVTSVTLRTLKLRK